MPDSAPEDTARTTDGPGPASRRPFVLAPFRGLHYDPARVGDLGTVISPPYDVLDAETVRDLENGNRRNIVRLILSRRFERPYLAVRAGWRAGGRRATWSRTTSRGCTCTSTPSTGPRSAG